MNLIDLLRRDCIKVPLEATDRKDVIDELVDLVCSAHDVRDAASIKAAVWEREQTRTTGIGQGLAIPHGKSEQCDRLLLGIGRPPHPIDFEAIDHKPVRLVVLVVSPPDRFGDHVQVLAAIARLMRIEAFRTAAYEADSSDEMQRLFEQYEPTTSSTG